MTDKHVVVFLGGTSGIGREAVKALLASPQPRPSWHIILGSRTPNRSLFGEEYLEESRNPNGDSVDCLFLDLSSLQSVRTFAAQLDKHTNGTMDTLVLCASVIHRKKRITEDGYEETIQVNALAETLLVDLLWPKLSSPGKKTRILFVSSALHLRAAKDKRLTPSTFDYYPSQKHYRPMSAYAHSKLLLMHIFFLTHLRSQPGSDSSASSPEPSTNPNPNPETYALSPGFVPQTGLTRDSGCLAKWASKWILPLLPFAKTPQQSGAFVAGFITPSFSQPSSAPGPVPAERSRPSRKVHHPAVVSLPTPGAYVSITKGEIRAAEECYDREVREAWGKVLRERGLWHGGMGGGLDAVI